MTVKIVKPIKVSDATMFASNIPEPDTARGEVEYDPSATTTMSFGGVVNTAIDASYDGNIYVLDGFDFYSSGTTYVREYTSSGSQTGNYFLVQALSKCIEVVQGSIYIGSASGYVYKYSKSGSQLDVYDLTASVSNCSGICFVGGRFYVIDQIAGKVLSFDSLFTDPKEIKVFDSTCPNAFGLTYKDGLIYYTNQAKGEIVSITAEGASSGEFNITNERSGLPKLGGIFFIGSNLMSINNYENKAYRYIGGLLTYPYNPGDRVILTSTHKVYQCLTATSDNPSDGATGDASATWIEVGPTNRWAAFVDEISTPTVINKDSLARNREWTIKPGEKFNSVSVFGCYGLEKVVFQRYSSSDVLIHSVNVPLIDSDAELEWGLDPGSPAFIDTAFYDGFKYNDGDYLKVIIDAADGFEGGISLIAFGISRLQGDAVNNDLKRNYMDLSTYDYDEFGTIKVTKRPVVKLNTYSIYVTKDRVDVVDRFINSLAGEFNVWYASIGDGQSLITYGSYERSPTNITHSSYRNYIATVRSAV